MNKWTTSCLYSVHSILLKGTNNLKLIRKFVLK